MSYKTQNEFSRRRARDRRARAQLALYVPDVNRSSDGTTTYLGERDLYSYRTLPARGLLLLSPSSSAAAWRPFLRDLLLSAAAGVALAALLSLVVARSIGRPIRRVAEATRGIAAAETHEPLPETGALEVAELARAFNEMAEQLRLSRDAERAFLLSVSHELKTPLTAISGWAEGLADGAFEPADAARTISLESGGSSGSFTISSIWRGCSAASSRFAVSRSTCSMSRARPSPGTRQPRTRSASSCARRVRNSGSKPTMTACCRSPRT